MGSHMLPIEQGQHFRLATGRCAGSDCTLGPWALGDDRRVRHVLLARRRVECPAHADLWEENFSLIAGCSGTGAIARLVGSYDL